VASRRELAWNRWVGWAPGLVNHTLLHLVCIPSHSVSGGSCILQGASVCQPTLLDHARRRVTLVVEPFPCPRRQAAAQSRPEPARAEPKLHANIVRRHQHRTSTLHFLLYVDRYATLFTTTTQAYYHRQHQHCMCTESRLKYTRNLALYQSAKIIDHHLLSHSLHKICTLVAVLHSVPSLS
jgi:hypothetical protein